jgi:predicted deacylase
MPQRSSSPTISPDPAADPQAARSIGSYDAGRQGPLVVIFGGIHGNEPAGVAAIAAVLAALQERGLPLRGRVLGLRGNCAGLAKGVRYQARDLNRSWQTTAIAAMLARDRASERSCPEDREERELLSALAPLLAKARAPITFLDLHSMSGDGAPFSCMADVLRNRKIAFALPVPVVLGLEEVIDGSMLGFFSDLGHVGVAVEGGQHDDPRTQANHEAAIWLTLVAAGCLRREQVGDLALHHGRLAAATAGLPRVLEIRHRHVVKESDDFVMRPGYANFQPVRAGEAVADDQGGPVMTPEGGVMMLPRYQGQGEDGYFLARAVSPVWLAISAGLRRARVDRLVRLLPGVARGVADGELLVAAGRPRAVDVFHLFGYRHERAREGRLVFSRRRPDSAPLADLPSEIHALLAEHG